MWGKCSLFLLLGRDAENEELSTISHRFVDVLVFPIPHPSTYSQTHPPNTTQRTVLSTLLTICVSGCIIHGDAPTNSHLLSSIFVLFYASHLSKLPSHRSFGFLYILYISSYQRTHVFSCVSIFLFSSHTYTHTQHTTYPCFGSHSVFIFIFLVLFSLELVGKYINNEYIQWIRWHAMEWIDACVRCRSGLTASAPLQTPNNIVPLLCHPIYLSLFCFAILEWSGDCKPILFSCTRWNALG